MTSESSKYVWYAGYGSNLFRERFLCYIRGGKFRLGGSDAKGCTDTTLPIEDRPFIISHSLFFAMKSVYWQNEGIAFISSKPTEKEFTYGRLWKVTKNQFDEIWEQEGKSKYYPIKIDLGSDEGGVPIWTITNNSDLSFSKPSKKYVKTISLGLKETYQLSNETISKYMVRKGGIHGNFTEKDLMKICQSV